MKKKYILLIELLIWFFVLAAGLYFFFYNAAIKDNVKNSYYIFVEDAGGLVQGSPVRLMGINIGHVRDVKIFDNKVFVSFLITKDETELPRKVLATIEFYGLGGSTSLELMPAKDQGDESQVIMPSESYRVQDYWDGSELASNVMIDTYTSVGRSIDKADLINNKKSLMQSSLLKGYSDETERVNTAQSVIIYKLTESTLDYNVEKSRKEFEEKMKNELENISEEEKGVQVNE